VIFINKQEKMRISDLKKSIREMIVAELSEAVAYKVSGVEDTTQSFPNDTAAKKFDTLNTNVTLKKLEEETPNPLSKKLTDLEKEESSLMSRLNKISQLKKEVESSLDINEVSNIEEDVNFTFQGELTPAGEIAQEFIKNNPEIKGGKLVKALSSDEEFQKALDKTEKITKKPQKDIYQNQTQRFYDLVMGNRELGQRGRKADPNTATKKSEEEKAKEEKKSEKVVKKAEKEKEKAPAQKSSSPIYNKTTTMVDMPDEPSDSDISRAEKELGIDTPKVKKLPKLSAEEKDKFDIALKGITAKINRIKNKEAKSDDLTLLKKAYGNEDVKKLFKKAGKDLDDLVAGIITTKKDKFDNVENDEI